MATGRNLIKPLTICMIGVGGFISSHLCEKLLEEMPHKLLAVDVHDDKIKCLLKPASSQWTKRIQFFRLYRVADDFVDFGWVDSLPLQTIIVKMIERTMCYAAGDSDRCRSTITSWEG
ncbi:hypothetical protein C2S52_012066 [Perilla frutescens var. hirtella]|nr:hypothetical protein C2S52_012066 [Perilla frutescens var. hirtella]